MSKPEIAIEGIFVQHDATDMPAVLQKLIRIMEKELAGKQKTIELYEAELMRLRKEQENKDAELVSMKQQLLDAHENAEGCRQLVNKLLNDIERMQQDISWYKRTFENRSFLGTIREKILKSKNAK